MNQEKLRALSSEKREGVRRNAERLVQDGNAAQKAAGSQALAALDEIEAEERQKRAAHIADLNQGQRVLEAFRLHPATKTEIGLIEVLMANPWANSAELAVGLGWAAGGGWHMHFGKMCSARGEHLWPAPSAEKRDADFYCGILCNTSWETGTLTYALKPEVETAFGAMGLRARPKAV